MESYGDIYIYIYMYYEYIIYNMNITLRDFNKTVTNLS